MTFDKASVSASMLAEQNARKEAVAAGETSSEVERVVTRLTALDEAGIYNLVGSDATTLTEIAWRLVITQTEWGYVPWLPPPEDVTAEKVVVDHVAATRVASRRVREIRTFDSAETVIAISQDILPEINNIIRVSNTGNSE